MKVNFYANFRALVGGKTIELALPDGGSISQLIDCLIEQFPALKPKMLDEQGSLARHIHIFINGLDATTLPDALETKVSTADKIDIFPPIAGG